MKSWFLQLLQKALNRYLQLDPESKERLRVLHGKVVTVELLGIGQTLQVAFNDNQIHLLHTNFKDADTYIKGTPLTFVRMVLTQDDRKHFFADDVVITGDLDLAQDVIALFDRLEIDWEEYVSHWTGDIPAHHLGSFVRRLQKFSQRTQRVMNQNVTEYLQEEAQFFPAAEAINDFYEDVDELRMDVDRIAARVALLKRNGSESHQ